MTKLEALKELAAKVEADLDTAHHHAEAFPSESAYGHCTWHDSHKAANGSLGAAKALHEAVLPRWRWRVAEAYGPNTVAHRTFWVSRPESWRSGHTADALKHGDARAWLLAILRALISQET